MRAAVQNLTRFKLSFTNPKHEKEYHSECELLAYSMDLKILQLVGSIIPFLAMVAILHDQYLLALQHAFLFVCSWGAYIIIYKKRRGKPCIKIMMQIFLQIQSGSVTSFFLRRNQSEYAFVSQLTASIIGMLLGNKTGQWYHRWISLLILWFIQLNNIRPDFRLHGLRLVFSTTLISLISFFYHRYEEKIQRGAFLISHIYSENLRLWKEVFCNSLPTSVVAIAKNKETRAIEIRFANKKAHEEFSIDSSGSEFVQQRFFGAHG